MDYLKCSMYTILSVTNRELFFSFCLVCSQDAACCVFQICKAESRAGVSFPFSMLSRCQDNSILIKLEGVSSISWKTGKNWCEFFFKCLVAFSSESV